MDPDPKAVIAAAALAPALVAGILVARAVRGPGRSWVDPGIAFAWGAAVTAIATAGNELGRAGLAALCGADRAGSLVPVLVGPPVEEIAKATGFAAVALATRGRRRDVHDALAYGALLGLGFAASENVGYYTVAAVQAGWPGLARAVYFRGLVESGLHATFTAVVGLGVAWAHASGRRVRPIATALVAAVLLHASWNAIALELGDRLCNAPAPGAACTAPDPRDLLVTMPALLTAFVAPVVAVLATLARRVA